MSRGPQPKRADLDVASAPLEGVSLIEANAGTGKTWTITALYVRLLLEAGCSVDSILVVTFTEAATGELRDRIRQRLADTRAAFERGAAEAGDAFTQDLIARGIGGGDALPRLTSALCDFDRAPIYTIHGFCQRVLGDSAFESGMPFRTELMPDPSALMKEIIDDYWRNLVHGASPLFTRYLLSQKLTPEMLRDAVQPYLGKPYLELRPRRPAIDVTPFESGYVQARGTAREIWLTERERIATLLGRAELHGGRYPKASIPRWLDEMHACLAPEPSGLDLCDKFDKFTPETLRQAARKGAAAPEHVFFDACARLKDAHAALTAAYAGRVVQMKVDLVDHVGAELAARKSRARVQSFDDLLLNLESALKGTHGEALAARLRAKYRAGLIDEFQDTDPVQYGIFSRIYAGGAEPVFFVGDPKQSIYSFRGADVYVYLEARAQAQRAHTLTVNWRSAPALLKAVNAIFGNAPAPFAIPDIGFQPSKPGGMRGTLEIDGDDAAPFRLWLAESADGAALSKGEAGEQACAATAAEIVRLLNLGARGAARIIEDGIPRRLCGGDIAVLVRSHRQAGMIRSALAARGVASVQRDGVSIFETHEAEELERVLAAVADPGRETLIGAALATEMLGHTGEALEALRADEEKWDAALESFREAHRHWHERGFIHMARALLERYDVLVRLLGYADGERRATNLLHLTEILHGEAGALGVGGLLAWLSAKRKAPAEGIEAELLRLESDENLVRISTMHAAKGLEFPIVLCPFLWDGTVHSAKDPVIAFHEEGATRRHAVVDFGSDSQGASREQAMLEERAENLRLAYVALTRAKYRCYMAWGHIKEAETSAPAWLLHRGADESGVAAAFGAGDIPRLGASKIREDLERIAETSGGSIGVSPIAFAAPDRFESGHAGSATLAERPFDRDLRDTRRVTSFTALTHGRTIEAPDYDASDTEPAAPAGGGRDIFGFPRGAHAGKCLHAIFEQVDFTRCAKADVERVVSRALDLHGFDAAWLPAVAGTIRSVVDTPLDDTGMRLREVARARRLDELEFYYPIARLTAQGLRRILGEAAFPDEIRERVGDLTFAPMRGYMRGFIDLVFEHRGRYYLADYKSNWLGASVSAYGQAALCRAMARESYFLQYLVYCVALHRYLAARVRGYRYETHFGGVRYLFVRGMTPATGAATGVFGDRPSEGFVGALDRYFASGAA